MNFSQFQDFRTDTLRSRPEVTDAGETNLYRALSWLQVPAPKAPPPHIHRCHLAQAWLDHYDLPASLAAQAMVSSGVRHSLAILFAHYAEAGYKAWLPLDNYPVYQSLADDAGLDYRCFATMPKIIWPEDGELLLLTNPLKPKGDFLTSDDIRQLKCWLSNNPKRRLLLDTVYNQESPFHSSTRELLKSEQVILLHSLSKAWLQPKLFGIALLPSSDRAQLVDLFRARPPSMAQLQHADHLLNDHAELPQRVFDVLSQAARELSEHLPDALHTPLAGSYLFPAPINFRTLLETHNILGIPATAFGSEDSELTILSSLSFAREAAPL